MQTPLIGERGLGFYQQPGIRCWPLRWPSGHIDILGALLLVVSVAALARHWRSIAAGTFGLAVAVKFQPIVVVPLYWKRVRIDAAVAAAVVGLLYVSFLNRGLVPTGSLGTYVWPLQPG